MISRGVFTMSIDKEIPGNAKGIDWNDVLVHDGKAAVTVCRRQV